MVEHKDHPNNLVPKVRFTVAFSVLGSCAKPVQRSLPQLRFPRWLLLELNKDGYVDLVLQYKLLGLGFNLSSTEGCITGMLTDGTLIEGCDSVRMVPPS